MMIRYVNILMKIVDLDIGSWAIGTQPPDGTLSKSMSVCSFILPKIPFSDVSTIYRVSDQHFPQIFISAWNLPRDLGTVFLYQLTSITQQTAASNIHGQCINTGKDLIYYNWCRGTGHDFSWRGDFIPLSWKLFGVNMKRWEEMGWMRRYSSDPSDNI